MEVDKVADVVADMVLDMEDDKVADELENRRVDIEVEKVSDEVVDMAWVTQLKRPKSVTKSSRPEGPKANPCRVKRPHFFVFFASLLKQIYSGRDKSPDH